MKCYEKKKEIILQRFEVNIDHCPEEMCSLSWKLNTAFALLLLPLQPLSSRNTVGCVCGEFPSLVFHLWLLSWS